MAANSYGSRGEPQFAGNGEPADAEDLTLLGSEIAAKGTRRVGTLKERDALQGADKFNGLRFKVEGGREYELVGGQWVILDSAILWGSAGALRGNAAPAGSGVLVQTGNQIVTSNASGDLTLALPKAFPNGLLSFQAMSADSSVGQVSFSVINTGGNTGSLNLRMYRGSDPIGGISARVTWIAFGH
jgi:hypothetical protein